MKRRSPASRGKPCETGATLCAWTTVGVNNELPLNVDASIAMRATAADRFLVRTPRHVNGFVAFIIDS
jgi:hypothetical protein